MDHAVSEPHFEYCLCQSWHIPSKTIILMQNTCHLSGHVYSQLISAFYHLLLVGLGPKDKLASRYELWRGLKRWSGLIIFLSLDLDLISEEKIFYDIPRFCTYLKYELVETQSKLWKLDWGRKERGYCENSWFIL